MKYLNTYKLFESDEVISNEEVAELIEECKDIVETFNESEDAFKVANYETGFVKYDTYLGRTIVGNFESRQSHESDMTAIKFNLGLVNDLNSSGYFKDAEESVTTEKIDDLIKLLGKSKVLVQRLSRYCDTIYYKLNGKSIRFMLIFKNPDESSSKKAKVKRLFDKLSDDFKHYDTWKTMNLVQFTEDRFPEKYRKLYDLIKTNPNLIDGRYGQWNESRRSNLKLRFAASETIDGDTIIVNISGFKYKTYMMDKFKAIRLSNEEKVEAMKCIEQKIKNSLRSDAESIETSIVGNQIKVKVK